MKALRMNDFGKIEEVTELVELVAPSLKEGQALVKMIASPIHPSDVYLIRGDYPREVAFPHTMGNEGIGEVIETHESVENVTEGDIVLIPVGVPSWKTQIVAPARRLVPVPIEDKEKQLQLAMSTINPPTAYLMLHNFVDLQEGDWIVQNAANSAVGRYIIQLASDMGVKTINLVRREELFEELQEIGADVVLVDDGTAHWKVREVVGDGQVKLGIDAVAGEASTRLMKCMVKGATLVAYGSMSQEPVELNLGVMLAKDTTVKSFWLSTWYQQTPPEEVVPLLQKLGGMIMQGKLHAKVAKTFTLDQYQEALEYADSDSKGGKVLFVNE